MRRWLSIGLTSICAATLVACSPALDLPPEPKGVPVADLVRAQPQIGLAAPFPDWGPLPGEGLAVGAELVRPQPPYGAAAVVMLKIKSSYDAFTAAYRRRLADRGYALRSVPIGLNFGLDPPLAAFDAQEARGGHVLYMVFRGDSRARYVQITFWAPPAPKLLP